MSLKIFCFSIKKLKLLNKLPSYIVPFGLGDNDYPNNWLNEKTGENILHLNKFYGEATGMYWLWKNYLTNFKENDWIGFCQYRRLWLDKLYESKQKDSNASLYSKLLDQKNDAFHSSNAILLQQTVMKDQNLIQQFDKIYGRDIISQCADLVNDKDRSDFKEFLQGNKMSICNMFITKPKIFKEYCEDMFYWIDKCYEYCKENDLMKDKNLRLPIFMVERFTSFWFEKNTNVKYLSFARLGNFFLSEKINSFLNPMKLPYTFKMYPTIHRY